MNKNEKKLENENENENENEKKSYIIFYAIAFVSIVVFFYFTYNTSYNVLGIFKPFLESIYSIIKSIYNSLYDLLKGIYMSLVLPAVPAEIYTYGLEPILSFASYLSNTIKYLMSTFFAFLIRLTSFNFNFSSLSTN